jgi:hypothetical protein
MWDFPVMFFSINTAFRYYAVYVYDNVWLNSFLLLILSQILRVLSNPDISFFSVI